jgi:hypothetical protein
MLLKAEEKYGKSENRDKKCPYKNQGNPEHDHPG